MKKQEKRNKVRVNSNGKYLMAGLNKSEKESLISKRNELLKNVDKSVVDQYIIALYNSEDNEVYFVDEASMSNDERAILV
jgi:hypothetical protein